MYKNSEKIVVKFGGSSLANAQQIKKTALIIKANKNRVYCIPSAPGKRFPGDDKVTDLLIKCYEQANAKLDFYNSFLKVSERYDSIIEELSLDLSLNDEYEEILSRLKGGTTIDYVASRGEFLNGLILAKYLDFSFIDAAEMIFFDEDGVFDSEKTNRIMAEKLSKVKNAVIPGFYGSLPDGSIKTFSRGGSDITGAIVSRAVMAKIYENWTDVSGFLMCDPKIVKDPKQIRVITYRELRELSYMGATVLHEDSIFPVKHAGIPINIRNTNSPDDPGTLIVTTTPEIDDPTIVTGIAGKKGFTIVHIEKDMMNQEKGFGMRVLQVLHDLNISFEHLPSGIDTMCVVISENELNNKEEEVITGIAQAVNPDSIEVERNVGLIAVVGRGMINKPGTAYRVFKSIAKDNINIRMIDQGSSEMNIIIGVLNADFEKTIRLIYEEFCC